MCAERTSGYAAPLVKKEPAQFSELRGGMTRAEGIRAGVVVCVWGFVSCVANGLVGAPWTELLMETACERQNITFGTPTCDSSEAAQAEATDRTSFLSIGQQLGGFLSIGLVSVLADARGRKPAMILITVGAATYPCAVWLLPSMGRVAFLPFEGFWLVLAVSVLGNLLGTAAFLSVSMSVMGDISAGLSPAARTNLFMALEAATWGGQMVGPLIGAKLAVRYGYKSPFMWATFACGAAILILLLFYRETLADAQRVKFDWARANPLGQLKPLVEHPVMIRFAIILGPTYLFAVCATQTITNLYLMRVAHADVVELSIVGVGGSLSQFVGAVGLVVLLPLLQKAGVGRAPIIVMALLSTVVQMSGWASLAYPSVQHFVGDKVFNALPYVISAHPNVLPVCPMLRRHLTCCGWSLAACPSATRSCSLPSCLLRACSACARCGR